MIVYICCAGGGSSSMFCLKIAQAAKQTALAIHFSDLPTVLANEGAFSRTYDIVFAYGPIGAINRQTAKRFSKIFDGIFVCPQVRYLTESKQELMRDLNVPIKNVDSLTFGRMQGEKALDTILEDLIAMDIERSGFAPTQKNQAISEQNFTIFLTGGQENTRFFTSLVDTFQERGIRILAEAFTPTTFYELHRPKQDYDIRLLYGKEADIREQTFLDFAEQVNLVLVDPMNAALFQRKATALQKLHVPSAFIDMVSYGRSDGRRIVELLEDTLLEASLISEYQNPVDYFDNI